MIIHHELLNIFVNGKYSNVAINEYSILIIYKKITTHFELPIESFIDQVIVFISFHGTFVWFSTILLETIITIHSTYSHINTAYPQLMQLQHKH